MLRPCFILLCVALLSACAPSASPTPLPITAIPTAAFSPTLPTPTLSSTPSAAASPSATSTALARIVSERPTPIPAPNCFASSVPASATKDVVSNIAVAETNRIYASVFSAIPSRTTLFTSDDDGATWTVTFAFNDFVSKVAVSPAFEKDHTIYAAGAGGVYRSLSSGSNWATVTPPTWVTTTNIVRQFAVSPNFANDHTILLGSRSAPRGVFASTDGGATWIDWLVDAVDALFFSPNYAADHAVWVTRNDEQTFRRDVLVTFNEGTNCDLARAGTAQPLAISPAFAQDGTIIWSDALSGLFISRNGDKVFPSLEKASADALRLFRFDAQSGWSAAGEQPISAVAFAPNFAQERTAFALGESLTIVSRGRGVSWSPACYWKSDASQPDALRLSQLAVTQSGTLIAGGAGARVVVSRDGGKSWTVVQLK